MEFNYLLQREPLFDHVLSPNPVQTEVFRYCQKKAWIRGGSFFKKRILVSWVFGDYIKELTRISQDGKPLQLLVIDDQAMLAVMAELKHRFPKKTELIYYHHGHSISLNPLVMSRVDKVLFLTRAGYRESVATSPQFTPEVEIVGNGVSSELFYPLTAEEKTQKRLSKGFVSDDIIITWMANSRPVKGIHLFEKMIPKLLEMDSRIKLQIIGNASQLDTQSNRVLQLGRLSTAEVAGCLQISDFYFFTSLWKEGFGLSLVEAIKSGNFILSSGNGGIKDVVEGYSRVSLIEDPNILNSWISSFSEILKNGSWRDMDDSTRSSLLQFFSMESWEQRIRLALR